MCDGSLPSTVEVLLGQGDGTFGAPMSFAAGSWGPEGVVVARDFDGDGVLDLAVPGRAAPGASSQTVAVLLGQGDGTFQAPLNFGTGFAPASMAVDDFNGDGKPDLAVANEWADTLSVLIQGPPGPNAIWISPVNVTLGGLTRNAQSTVDFTLPTAGTVTSTTTSAKNGIATNSSNVAYATANNGAIISIRSFRRNWMACNSCRWPRCLMLLKIRLASSRSCRRWMYQPTR